MARELLVSFELNSMIDLENKYQNWKIGYVTRKCY